MKKVKGEIVTEVVKESPNEKFKINNITLFVLFTTLYILGYILFCASKDVVTINEAGKTTFVVLILTKFLPMSAVKSALNLSSNALVWLFVSMILVVGIISQINAKGQKTTRYGLVGVLINLYLTIASGGIVKLFHGDCSGIITIISVTVVLGVIIGVAFKITYNFLMESGKMNQYSMWCDILTQEEFDRLQEKKKNRKRR